MQQPPTPPSCSECATKVEAPGGGAPTQSASRMWRSGTGKMRIDLPHSSIITNPTDQKTILLDHVKKEATVIPTTPPASGSAAAGSPKAPPAAPPPAPPMQVQDLGKSMIEGHEVEGKRYVLPPAQKPQAPPMPKVPGLPQMPKSQTPAAPQLPKAPQPPKPPQPTVTEVWTSVKLKTPVLTKVTSALGSQTTYCKPTSTAEPHPSTFEIPPGYKLKQP